MLHFLPNSLSSSKKFSMALALMTQDMELRMKIHNVNAELQLLEMEVGQVAKQLTDEQRQQYWERVEEWRLMKKDVRKYVYHYRMQDLLRSIRMCEEGLDYHESYLTMNFGSRYQNLVKMLKKSEEVQECVVKERVAEKLLATTKAFLGEFKQELQKFKSQDTWRENLVQWLQQQHEHNFEWTNLNEKLVYVGIKISKVLLKFLVSMARSDVKIPSLRRKIESLAYVYEEKSTLTDKFLNVVDMAINMMSEMKVKPEVAFKASEEKELEKMILESIMDLDFIWSGMTVPDSSGMVAGALVRAQNVIGQILYNIHGVKVRIPEEEDERWKRFKATIGQLWRGEGQEG